MNIKNTKKRNRCKPFGLDLRFERRKRRRTQGDVALRLGITQQKYSLIERGGVNLSVSLFQKILDEFGYVVSISKKES